MNKLTISIIIAFVIFVTIFLSYYVLSRQGLGPKLPFQSNTSPTPVLTTAPNQSNQLTVIAVNPQNNTKNVPLNSQITLTFNQKIRLNEVVFSIAPEVPFTQKIQDRNLIITFNQNLSPGIPYSYVVKYDNTKILPQPFFFSTTGPTPRVLPNTYPEEYKEAEEMEKQTQPDVYLSNKTPFSTNDFSINSSFKPQPTGHFAFNVILKNSNQNLSRNRAIEWIKSFGLTDVQIQSLDITYQ